MRRLNVFDSKLDEFLPAMRMLNSHKPLTKQDLLSDQFLMARAGALKMYYAPHNEYINTQAKIIIVGITPGWNQMKTAFEQAVKSINLHRNMDQILQDAKIAASFAGTIRVNLINMLDQCGIPGIINAESSASLFTEQRHALHTTSIIKYPVFHHEKNYTGHNPAIDQTPLLSSYAYQSFPEELGHIQQPALVIPLGKTVEQAIRKLLEAKKLPEHVYVFGFPHPSGANGHRKKQFQLERDGIFSVINEWSKRNKKVDNP